VHAFVNDRMRPIGTHLYGRRMYEVMRYWDDPPPGQPGVEQDFAELWQAGDKIVYSRTLEQVSTRRTRLERTFDPDAVRELKSTAPGDLLIAGPELAASAFAAGLVDEVQLYLVPVIVGGGKPALPAGVWLDLALHDVHRFIDGTVFLRYAARTG
jgi:dihydrofolate reductase